MAEVLNPASGVLATSQELESGEAIAKASGDKPLSGVREVFLDAQQANRSSPGSGGSGVRANGQLKNIERCNFEEL